MKMDIGRLDRRITFERPGMTRDPDLNTPIAGSWQAVCTVWAQVQDNLPSRGEKLADGIDIAQRPARIRMRWRTDIDSSMRILCEGRVLQIVAGPAELGRRDGLELMAVEYSSAEGVA